MKMTTNIEHAYFRINFERGTICDVIVKFSDNSRKLCAHNPYFKETDQEIRLSAYIKGF